MSKNSFLRLSGCFGGYCRSCPFLSTHEVPRGVKTYQVLFDTKLLVITAHKEQAVFLTLTWLLYSHTSCQLLSKCEAFSDASCSLAVRLQKMTCWLCRKRQLAPDCREQRRGCSPPTSQGLAESTPRRVSGQVLFSWGGSRLRLGEQKLSRPLPGVSTLSSDWIQYSSPPRLMDLSWLHLWHSSSLTQWASSNTYKLSLRWIQ